MDRKKVVRALAGVQAALAALIILVPHFVFPVCDTTMHCYYSYMAEIGAGCALLASSAAMFMSRGMEAPRMLGMVGAVLGLFVILWPTTLIGVCGSPRMACHYGTLPVWNLLGGSVIILSGIIFLVAKEDKV